MFPDSSSGGVGVYAKGGDWFFDGVVVGGAGGVAGCGTCHGTVTKEIIGWMN